MSNSSAALQGMCQRFVDNRSGLQRGIYSVCASHPLVLEAVMRQALVDDSILLIEATANQVNQFGGYTGMKPADFPPYVYALAEKAGLAPDRIILGGDHLGPLCWANEAPEPAMEKARELVRAYVKAGFRKIHLDASMACAGDSAPLTDEVVAHRAAELCLAAEEAIEDDELPVYVIGTEVPIPGGETESTRDIEVTPANRAEHTVNTHRQAFRQAGLESAWRRVIALVVQPGVEFNHSEVHAYDESAASALSSGVLNFPILVYEAHSTDYQPPEACHALVRDHFAILKVGPALTFALREALFALCAIEQQLIERDRRSNLLETCERVMLREPHHWNRHYPPDEPAGRVLRRFSYSDRIRYYWPHPEIQAAVDQLMENLDRVTIPIPLLSQYLPGACHPVAKGQFPPEPRELVINHIMDVSAMYSEACR
jgi:D-tagatose-1,6-bisphosphate aldolase subunit GatZ/KbaZ